VLLGVRNTPKKEEKRGNRVTVTEDLHVLCRYIRGRTPSEKEDEGGRVRKKEDAR